MAAVDRATPPATSAPVAPGDAGGAGFYCSASDEYFASLAELRAHVKSERYVYNTKRRNAGLKPISQEAFDRKLRESRGAGAAERKGTAHLKANKPVRKGTGGDSQSSPAAGAADTLAAEANTAEEPSTPWDPRRCLFDRKEFVTVEECLAYMEKTYSFFIPDREYCTDVPGLLGYLGRQISEPPHACPLLTRTKRGFPDLASVRRHMIDKGHTQLVSEAHTRRGNYDEAGTNELQGELEPFYDYHASMREVAEKIKDPKQKVASLLRFFDADKDKKLDQQEIASLWAAVSDGAKLSEAQYEGACAMCDADPKDGLNVEAMSKLYAEGFADLDEHFGMLQDLLVKSKKKPLKVVEEGAEGEECEEGAEESDPDYIEGGESEDDEGDEVVECEDEDEFEEVMQILGLQAVTILPTGDLRLPNGGIAAHRDVAHIYRQRGVRMDQLSVVGARNPQRRSQLMISNSPAGCLKIAMSRRQEAKEGKRIIAVLRERSNQEMRLGMQHNIINKAKKSKIRTGRGDMSNGR